MKDVVFQGTKNRKPGGMAEVVLHLVRDDTVFDIEENELEDIDETLSEIDDSAVDMDEIEGVESRPRSLRSRGVDVEQTDFTREVEVETVKALAVGSAQVVETQGKDKTSLASAFVCLDFAPGEAVSVTRRLYLSGESEYQLNGKTCRLRDITDLFAGTGCRVRITRSSSRAASARYFCKARRPPQPDRGGGRHLKIPCPPACRRIAARVRQIESRPYLRHRFRDREAGKFASPPGGKDATI